MLLRPLEQGDHFAGTRRITYLAFATPAFYTAERVMRQPSWTGRLRTIRGIAATLIVAAFLIAHFGNHLVASIGTQTPIVVQDVLRLWYRHYVIEPVIVALFLFQVGSGLTLAFIYRFAHGDRFRTLITRRRSLAWSFTFFRT